MLLTYSSLISAADNGASRIQQIVDWCGPGFDGLVVFDGALRTLRFQSDRAHPMLWCQSVAVSSFIPSPPACIPPAQQSNSKKSMADLWPFCRLLPCRLWVLRHTLTSDGTCQVVPTCSTTGCVVQSATRQRTWCRTLEASRPRWERRCCSCSACFLMPGSSTALPQVRMPQIHMPMQIHISQGITLKA